MGHRRARSAEKCALSPRSSDHESREYAATFADLLAKKDFELATRLAALGLHGDIKLVSGATLELLGIGNRPTADIDAGSAEKGTQHRCLGFQPRATLRRRTTCHTPRFRPCETSATKTAESRFIPAAHRRPLKHLL